VLRKNIKVEGKAETIFEAFDLLEEEEIIKKSKKQKIKITSGEIEENVILCMLIYYRSVVCFFFFFLKNIYLYIYSVSLLFLIENIWKM
jgi:hypothetical protein